MWTPISYFDDVPVFHTEIAVCTRHIRRRLVRSIWSSTYDVQTTGVGMSCVDANTRQRAWMPPPDRPMEDESLSPRLVDSQATLSGGFVVEPKNGIELKVQWRWEMSSGANVGAD